MAKDSCPSCDCPQGVPLWLGTYGDMVTLILTFFILLLSMASFDSQRIAQAIGSIEGSLSILEKGSLSQINPPAPIKATPIKTDIEMENTLNVLASLITDYNEINVLANGPSVELKEAEKGIIISIPDNLLFESGSALIKDSSGIVFLKRLARELKKLPKEVRIKAIGHTDNTPLKANEYFADNFELSLMRGINVANFLSNQGVSKSRITGGGEGEFSPVANNDIPSLRAKNRRVDLYVYSIGQDLSGIMQSLGK